MQRIVSLVRDLPMQRGQLADRFLAVLAAFLPPAYHPLEALELLQTSFQVARIGNHRSIGEGGQLLHTQINADYGSGVLGHRLLLLLAV